MKLHIIYTEKSVILSKKSYLNWREIQDDYLDYKASLGPWSIEEVVIYLSEEYKCVWPSASEQVIALISMPDLVRAITFKNE